MKVKSCQYQSDNQQYRKLCEVGHCLTDEHNWRRCSEKIWVYKNVSVGRSCSPSVCVIVRQTNYVKPLLREPLLPGVWTVKMVYESALVAFTQFLVTPLQFVSGASVSQQQAGWVWQVWHVLFHIYLWRSQMTAGDFSVLLPCLQYTHLSQCVAFLSFFLSLSLSLSVSLFMYVLVTVHHDKLL